MALNTLGLGVSVVSRRVDQNESSVPSSGAAFCPFFFNLAGTALLPHFPDEVVSVTRWDEEKHVLSVAQSG